MHQQQKINMKGRFKNTFEHWQKLLVRTFVISLLTASTVNEAYVSLSVRSL